MVGNPEPSGGGVRLEGVRVAYGRRVQALRGVDLVVEPGEFVFLTGPTGAGKSTILRLLTGESHASEGRVVMDGRDVTRIPALKLPAHRRTMGVVPQDYALLPKKNVWENVAYALRAAGYPKRVARARVPSILADVGIGHRADAYPHQLSGGEQQRVAIGRALVNDPPLLLADEPTGNLDPERSWEIMELLVALNRNGTTVICASHDLLVVERLGRRIVALRDGKIEEDHPAFLC